MKRLQIAFIAYLAFLVAVAVGVTVYTQVNGKTCTVRMINNGFGYEISPEAFRVEFSDPTIAEVTDIRVVPGETSDTNTIEVDFHGLKKGRTYATVYSAYQNTKMTPQLKLMVNGSGNVLELQTLSFNGWQLVQGVLLSITALTAVVMTVFFFLFMRRARFSYAMVASGGTAMYCAFMFLLTLYDTQYMNSFRNFLISISDTGYWFVILTSPFMIIFCGLIAFSNIWLLRHEGFRPQNMLGIALAVAWVLGLAAVYQIDFLLVRQHSDYIKVCYSLAYVLSFLECMLLSTIACTFLSTRFKPPYDKKYLIILGCCIRPDGTLTPILKGRADAAIDFERRQFASTGEHAKFVPSGGQGADEVVSESEAMKRYLMEQGYPEEQIIMEDKSVNTFQNIMFSRDRIKEDAGGLDGIKAAFATTNYHVFRGYLLSRKHKLDAQGISAKTKWYFYPNAFLREFIGLLVGRKLFILAIILVLLGGFNFGIYMLNMGL